MSKYTTEVRFICEQACGLTESAGLSSVNNIIKQSAPVVFNFDFPVFDENYRLPLETKILRHYYTREICEETVGLWKLRLEDRLNLIMPYYNQLYESATLKFNPLYDVDYYKTGDRKNKGKTDTNNETTRTANGEKNDSVNMTTKHSGTSDVAVTGTNTNTLTGNDTEMRHEDLSGTSENTEQVQGTNWKLYSDTPQGGIDGVQDFLAGKSTYLTNVTQDNISNHTTANGTTSGTNTIQTTTTLNDKNTESLNTSTLTTQNLQDTENGTNTTTTTDSSTNTQIGTTNIDNTEEYVEHVSGKMGGKSYAMTIKEYRETFLNIDKMIIEELSDLFFGLW